MIFLVTCTTKDNPDQPIDLAVRHHSSTQLKKYFDEHGELHVPGYSKAFVRLHPKMLAGQEHDIVVDLDLSASPYTPSR